MRTLIQLFNYFYSSLQTRMRTVLILMMEGMKKLPKMTTRRQMRKKRKGESNCIFSFDWKSLHTCEKIFFDFFLWRLNFISSFLMKMRSDLIWDIRTILRNQMHKYKDYARQICFIYLSRKMHTPFKNILWAISIKPPLLKVNGAKVCFFKTKECYHLNCNFMQIFINHSSWNMQMLWDAFRGFHALIPVAIH